MRNGNDRLEAFLGDAGVAKQFSCQNSLKQFKNLPIQACMEEWMAPEIKNPSLIQLGSQKEDNKIDYRKIDIFSLGLITLYCLDYPNFEKYNRSLKDKSKKLLKVLFLVLNMTLK